jgi:fructan beta-fructosidase
MPRRGKLWLCLIMLGFGVGTVMAQANGLYHEPYRPQYHYSPPCRWMNDPNGMVYYEGEYHLFYQFNPVDSVPGPMHWGHAVSSDLVHWETLPIALYPDEIGPIWSGTVVVDDRNTSGLVPGGGLIALFTYENQSQGVAYSTDHGRTWTKYANNPVIDARARDFRDPKVYWHEATGEWVMVLAAGHEAQFFTSPNLLNWEFRSSFAEGHLLGVWEVPDLFPLDVEGETKWVLLISVSALAPAGGGGIQYFIGDFDGQTFTNDNPATTVLWLDYGQDNYAGTTWNNLPDGRRIYIGWMSNWQYAATAPTSPWRGATTLPRDFSLVRTADGIRLAQSPVASVAQLRELVGTWDDLTVSGELSLDNVHGRTLEIIADFELNNAQRFGFDVHRGESGRTRLVYNVAESQLLVSRSDPSAAGLNGYTTVFGAPTPLDNHHLRLHVFVDESSLEVFAQDGLITLTGQTFTNPADDGMALFSDDGDVKVTHLEVYSLASIWSPTTVAAAETPYC